jgi:hypothetical protein
MNAPADRAVAREGPQLADLGGLLVRNLRDLALDYAVLAVLDARRAAIRLGGLLAVGLVAAVLVSTAWLALVVAAAVALTVAGAPLAAVLALAGLVNVGVAAGLALWIKRRARELPFAATLRQLRGESPGKDADAGA